MRGRAMMDLCFKRNYTILINVENSTQYRIAQTRIYAAYELTRVPEVYCKNEIITVFAIYSNRVLIYYTNNGYRPTYYVNYYGWLAIAFTSLGFDIKTTPVNRTNALLYPPFVRLSICLPFHMSVRLSVRRSRF